MTGARRSVDWIATAFDTETLRPVMTCGVHAVDEDTAHAIAYPRLRDRIAREHPGRRIRFTVTLKRAEGAQA